MAMPYTKMDDDMYEEVTELVVDPRSSVYIWLQDTAPSIMMLLNIKLTMC